MRIARTDRGGAAVLTVVEPEEIDLAASEAFRASLTEAIGDADRVVVDVSRVQFFDSAGMGSLLAVHRAVEAAGGSLVLAGPARPVLEVFRMVGFDMVFRLYPDVDAALTDAWKDPR